MPEDHDYRTMIGQAEMAVMRAEAHERRVQEDYWRMRGQLRQPAEQPITCVLLADEASA